MFDKLVISTSLYHQSKSSIKPKPKIQLHNIYQKPLLNESGKSEENLFKNRTQSSSEKNRNIREETRNKTLNSSKFKDLKDFLYRDNFTLGDEHNYNEHQSMNEVVPLRTVKNVVKPTVERNLLTELLHNDSLTMRGGSRRDDHRRFFEAKREKIHQKMNEITNKSKFLQNESFANSENSDKNKDKSSFSIGNPKALLWNESFQKNLMEDDAPNFFEQKRHLIDEKWLNIFDNPQTKPLEYFLNMIEDKSQTENPQSKTFENKENTLDNTNQRNKSRISLESRKAKEKKILDFLNTYKEAPNQIQKSEKASIHKKRKELLRDLDRNFYRNEDIVLGNSIMLGDTELNTSRTIRTYEERRSASNRKKKITAMAYKYKNIIENMVVNKKIQNSVLNQSMNNNNNNNDHIKAERIVKVLTLNREEDDDVPLNSLYDKLKNKLNAAKMALTDDMFEEYEETLVDEENLRNISRIQEEIYENNEILDDKKHEFHDNVRNNKGNVNEEENSHNEDKTHEILKKSYINDKGEKPKKTIGSENRQENKKGDEQTENIKEKENLEEKNEPLKKKFLNFWDSNQEQNHQNPENKNNHIIEKLKNLKNALNVQKTLNQSKKVIFPLENQENNNENQKMDIAFQNKPKKFSETINQNDEGINIEQNKKGHQKSQSPLNDKITSDKEKFERNKDHPRQSRESSNVKPNKKFSLNLAKAKPNLELNSPEKEEEDSNFGNEKIGKRMITPTEKEKFGLKQKNLDSRKIDQLQQNLLTYSPIPQTNQTSEKIAKKNEKFIEEKNKEEDQTNFEQFNKDFDADGILIKSEDNKIENRKKLKSIKKNDKQLRYDDFEDEKTKDEPRKPKEIEQNNAFKQQEIIDDENFHNKGQEALDFKPISFSPIKPSKNENNLINSSRNDFNTLKINNDNSGIKNDHQHELEQKYTPVQSEQNLYKTSKNYQSEFKNDNFNEIENFILRTDEKMPKNEKKTHHLLNSQAKECQTDKSAMEMQELIEQMKFYKMDITLLTKPKFANYEELNEEEDNKNKKVVNRIFKKIAQNINPKNSFHSTSNVSRNLQARSGLIEPNDFRQNITTTPIEKINNYNNFNTCDESIKYEIFNAAQKLINNSRTNYRNIFESSSKFNSENPKNDDNLLPENIIQRLFPKIVEENNSFEGNKNDNGEVSVRLFKDNLSDKIRILFGNLEKMQMKRNLEIFFAFKQDFNVFREKNFHKTMEVLLKILFIVDNQYKNILKSGFVNIKNFAVREKWLSLGKKNEIQTSKIELMASSFSKKFKKNMTKGFKRIYEMAVFLKKKEEKSRIYLLNSEMLKKKILKKIKIQKLHVFGKIKEYSQFKFLKHKNSIYILHLLFEQKKPNWLSYGFWQLKRHYITERNLVSNKGF